MRQAGADPRRARGGRGGRAAQPLRQARHGDRDVVAGRAGRPRDGGWTGRSTACSACASRACPSSGTPGSRMFTMIDWAYRKGRQPLNKLPDPPGTVRRGVRRRRRPAPPSHRAGRPVPGAHGAARPADRDAAPGRANRGFAGGVALAASGGCRERPRGQAGCHSPANFRRADLLSGATALDRQRIDSGRGPRRPLDVSTPTPTRAPRRGLLLLWGSGSHGPSRCPRRGRRQGRTCGTMPASDGTTATSTRPPDWPADGTLRRPPLRRGRLPRPRST